MGRKAHAQSLDVWMNGIPVGTWTRAAGEERLDYFDSWIAAREARPLSLSLPFTPGNTPWRGAAVAAFFDNLLPDSDAIRRRLAQRHRLAGTQAFDLLTALGRDCVGALQLLPAGQAPHELASIQGDVLDEAGIAALLRAATTPAPLGDAAGDDLRLSIAGAQEKTALLRQGDRWLLPHGSTPTTHIFKLPLGRVGNMQADMRTSVENEWLCARLVAAFGLPVAHCDMARFEDQKVLVVERFDRRPARDGRWIVRLPQEDMCQATGTSPLLKYQADGGPGIAAIMAILAGSARADADRRDFFKAQVVFWLLAATDGHAKNFSITHLPQARYQATPLYDVLSAHPIIGRGRNHIAPQKARLAMAVRGRSNHYLIERIEARHWVAQAQQVGLGQAAAEDILAEVAAAAPGAVDAVSRQLPAGFPADVADAVFAGMVRQAQRLAG
ncbi:MAG: type II toxin-antitoxin system HipA family toxin [Rhodocyclaceae bacterium]